MRFFIKTLVFKIHFILVIQTLLWWKRSLAEANETRESTTVNPMWASVCEHLILLVNFAVETCCTSVNITCYPQSVFHSFAFWLTSYFKMWLFFVLGQLSFLPQNGFNIPFLHLSLRTCNKPKSWTWNDTNTISQTWMWLSERKKKQNCKNYRNFHAVSYDFHFVAMIKMKLRTKWQVWPVVDVNHFFFFKSSFLSDALKPNAETICSKKKKKKCKRKRM